MDRFSRFLTEASKDQEAKHLEKLEKCKTAVQAVLSKHGCRLVGTRFGVLVGAGEGKARRIKL